MSVSRLSSSGFASQRSSQASRSSSDYVAATALSGCGGSDDKSSSSDLAAPFAYDSAKPLNMETRSTSQNIKGGGVRVKDDDDVAVEVHLAVDAGVSIPALGRETQQRIAEYLERMTGTTPASVDVVVHEIGG